MYIEVCVCLCVCVLHVIWTNRIIGLIFFFGGAKFTLICNTHSGIILWTPVSLQENTPPQQQQQQQDSATVYIANNSKAATLKYKSAEEAQFMKY